MSFFVQDAIAATTAPAPQGEGAYSLLMVVAMFVLFYFVLIRPQSKRAKQQREMISQLKKGDEVVVAQGILARIVSMNDQYLKVALADGIEITIQRSAVNSVLPKGTLKSL